MAGAPSRPRAPRRSPQPQRRPAALIVLSAAAAAAADPGRPPARPAEPETAASPGRAPTAGPRRRLRDPPPRPTAARANERRRRRPARRDFRPGGGPAGGGPRDRGGGQWEAASRGGGSREGGRREASRAEGSSRCAAHVEGGLARGACAQTPSAGACWARDLQDPVLVEGSSPGEGAPPCASTTPHTCVCPGHVLRAWAGTSFGLWNCSFRFPILRGQSQYLPPIVPLLPSASPQLRFRACIRIVLTFPKPCQECSLRAEPGVGPERSPTACLLNE